MAKMVVTDRDGNVHEIEGRPGVKLMETLREYDWGVTPRLEHWRAWRRWW